MPISNLEEYKKLLSSNRDLININIAAATTVIGRSLDLFRTTLPAGVAATTPIAPTNETLGAIGQYNSSGSLENFIVGSRWSGVNAGVYLVCDRLSHQGGLNTTSTAVQTTNLPTAALTRYTDGVGVLAALSIQTQVGTVATSAVVEYTNHLGTSGLSSIDTQIGGTGFREANRFIILPLNSGDKGVKSVESFQVKTSTTTAGNVSIVLFKPLYVICVESVNGVLSAGFITGYTSGGIPKIENNACLFLVAVNVSNNAAGSGALLIGEA